MCPLAGGNMQKAWILKQLRYDVSTEMMTINLVISKWQHTNNKKYQSYKI